MLRCALPDPRAIQTAPFTTFDLRPGAGPATDRTGHAHGETCAGGNILYFRDPSGEPNFSAEPKKNAAGRDYVPVCDDEEVSLDPPRKADRLSGSGKILYYRNPMGLADVSPVPKKDSMGMDYIPVYESEAPGDSNTIKLSVDKIQRSGVRTEVVDMRKLADQVHAYGTVKYDERRLTIVSVSADGIVDDVFVNTIGQYVRAGDPLFRIYSNSNQNIQMLQLEISRRQRPGATAPDAGIQQYLTNVPRPGALDWPSPVTGTVIDKRIVIGQRIEMKDELYRIADLSRMWVIAEVAESDIALVKQGTRAQVVLRAYPHQPVEGTVIFIYPELRQETRTARVTIEVLEAEKRPVAAVADHNEVRSVSSLDAMSRKPVL